MTVGKPPGHDNDDYLRYLEGEPRIDPAFTSRDELLRRSRERLCEYVEVHGTVEVNHVDIPEGFKGMRPSAVRSGGLLVADRQQFVNSRGEVIARDREGDGWEMEQGQRIVADRQCPTTRTDGEGTVYYCLHREGHAGGHTFTTPEPDAVKLINEYRQVEGCLVAPDERKPGALYKRTQEVLAELRAFYGGVERLVQAAIEHGANDQVAAAIAHLEMLTKRDHDLWDAFLQAEGVRTDEDSFMGPLLAELRQGYEQVSRQWRQYATSPAVQEKLRVMRDAVEQGVCPYDGLTLMTTREEDRLTCSCGRVYRRPDHCAAVGIDGERCDLPWGHGGLHSTMGMPWTGPVRRDPDMEQATRPVCGAPQRDWPHYGCTETLGHSGSHKTHIDGRLVARWAPDATDGSESATMAEEEMDATDEAPPVTESQEDGPSLRDRVAWFLHVVQDKTGSPRREWAAGGADAAREQADELLNLIARHGGVTPASPGHQGDVTVESPRDQDDARWERVSMPDDDVVDAEVEEALTIIDGFNFGAAEHDHTLAYRWRVEWAAGQVEDRPHLERAFGWEVRRSAAREQSGVTAVYPLPDDEPLADR